MNELAGRIAELIAAEGPLPVAQYMTICLHDPHGGAYAARQPIGRDFITAPEISQTFGELIGLWAVQCWHDQDRPASSRLCELGPGRGTLMADALRAIKTAAPEFLRGAEVVLVESSPALTAEQRERLKDFANIAWADRFDDRLADRPLFLIANEFFDCLPVRQFVKTDRGWFERLVTLRDEALGFALARVPSAVPSDRAAAPDGGVYEVSPAALALAERIAQVIAGRGGAALITDYGYDAPGFGETLQALAHGAPVDVLAAPGESDLTAHVDFAALARAGLRSGAQAFGPVSQRDLLTALGIGPRAERLMGSNPQNAKDIAGAVNRLIDPRGMGTLFKALAFLPKDVPAPPGFPI